MGKMIIIGVVIFLVICVAGFLLLRGGKKKAAPRAAKPVKVTASAKAKDGDKNDTKNSQDSGSEEGSDDDEDEDEDGEKSAFDKVKSIATNNGKLIAGVATGAALLYGGYKLFGGSNKVDIHNEYSSTAQRLYRSMPSVVQGLADKGAIKSVKKAIAYDKPLVASWSWTDMVMSPWHGVEWILFKTIKFFHGFSKSSNKMCSPGMLTSYAQATAFSIMTLGYNRNWWGHEGEGALSQAIWAVVGLPIRIPYLIYKKCTGEKDDKLKLICLNRLDVSKLTGDLKKIYEDRKSYLNRGYVPFESVTASDIKKHKFLPEDTYPFVFVKKAYKTLGPKGKESSTGIYEVKDNGVKKKQDFKDKTDTEVLVFTPIHTNKGKVVDKKEVKDQFVGRFNPIRLWDALVGNPVAAYEKELEEPKKKD